MKSFTSKNLFRVFVELSSVISNYFLVTRRSLLLLFGTSSFVVCYYYHSTEDFMVFAFATRSLPHFFTCIVKKGVPAPFRISPVTRFLVRKPQSMQRHQCNSFLTFAKSPEANADTLMWYLVGLNVCIFFTWRYAEDKPRNKKTLNQRANGYHFTQHRPSGCHSSEFLCNDCQRMYKSGLSKEEIMAHWVKAYANMSKMYQYKPSWDKIFGKPSLDFMER